MLRVFKPTSPMSMGSWIARRVGRRDGRRRRERAARGSPRAPRRGGRRRPALLGAVLATYTGVLLANTAVPAWHEARRELPFVFAGSAAASAGAAVALATPARRRPGAPARASAARRCELAGHRADGAAARLRRRAVPRGRGRAALAAREGADRGRRRRAALAGRRRAGAVAGGALLLGGGSPSAGRSSRRGSSPCATRSTWCNRSASGCSARRRGPDRRRADRLPVPNGTVPITGAWKYWSSPQKPGNRSSRTPSSSSGCESYRADPSGPPTDPSPANPPAAGARAARGARAAPAPGAARSADRTGAARGEVVRMRAGRHVHERMRVSADDVAPTDAVSEAMLAVARRRRGTVGGEDDVHDLPVALVRLPDEVAGGVDVRVRVVVVEVPVLEHDRVATCERRARRPSRGRRRRDSRTRRSSRGRRGTSPDCTSPG